MKAIFRGGPQDGGESEILQLRRVPPEGGEPEPFRLPPLYAFDGLAIPGLAGTSAVVSEGGDVSPIGAYWPCFAADGPGEGLDAERDAEGRYVYLFSPGLEVPQHLTSADREGRWPRAAEEA